MFGSSSLYDWSKWERCGEEDLDKQEQLSGEDSVYGL
jgi:hypothetical protein